MNKDKFELYNTMQRSDKIPTLYQDEVFLSTGKKVNFFDYKIWLPICQVSIEASNACIALALRA